MNGTRILSALLSGFLLVGALAISGCARSERFEFTRLCMGVQTRILVYADDSAAAESGAAAAFDRIAELDQCMSDYRPSSELMRLCAAPSGVPVPVSDDLFYILSRSHEIAEASGGAFDITVGPCVAMWRQARQSGRLPDPAAAAEAKSFVNWTGIHLDPQARTAALAIPGMRLDLGGIAKGFAADQALRTLRARGLPRCLVALAGDISAGEPPPGRAGWTVTLATEPILAPPRGETALAHGVSRGSAGVQAFEPRRGATQPPPPPRTILLHNASISTSGSTEQFIEIDGRRYSHIIDPRTCLGSPSLREVTVTAPRGELADALATVGCLLDPDEFAAVLIRFPGCRVVAYRQSR